MQHRSKTPYNQILRLVVLWLITWKGAVSIIPGDDNGGSPIVTPNNNDIGNCEQQSAGDCPTTCIRVNGQWTKCTLLGGSDDPPPPISDEPPPPPPLIRQDATINGCVLSNVVTNEDECLTKFEQAIQPSATNQVTHPTPGN